MTLSHLAWHVSIVLVAVNFVFTAPAHGAADWKWTKGQGWTRGAGRPRASAGEQLRYAYQLEQKGEYYDAASQYFLLLKVYPQTREAGVALQRLGKCLFDLENYYQAYQAFEQVIRSYPRSGRTSNLMAIEYKIAKKLQAGKARISLLDKKTDPKVANRKAAVEVFKSIIKHDPYGPLADDALLGLGDTYLLLKDPKSAREQYKRFLREFPKSALAERARLGETRCDVLEGKANTADVQQQVESIRSKNPEGLTVEGEEGTEQIDESITEMERVEAGRMWKQAAQYERQGTHRSVKAARFIYTQITVRYPRTSYAAHSRKKLLTLRVPPDKKSRFSLPKLNLNPFRKEKHTPAFETPQVKSEKVVSSPVVGPVPGVAESGFDPRSDGTRLMPAANTKPVPLPEESTPPPLMPGPTVQPVVKEPPAPHPDEAAPPVAVEIRPPADDSAAGAIPAAKRNRKPLQPQQKVATGRVDGLQAPVKVEPKPAAKKSGWVFSEEFK